MKLTPYHSCAAAILLVASAPVISASSTQTKAFADVMSANYPASCINKHSRKQLPIKTGFCLLGSTSPLAIGNFRVADDLIASSGNPRNLHKKSFAVKLNTTLALPPGIYSLYHANKLDDFHSINFSVKQGEVTTLKTATMAFQNSAGQYTKLQHFQSIDASKGEGCRAEIGTRGVHAYLPGSYIVSTVASLKKVAPKCEHQGVAFNVMAGKAVNIHLGTFTAQTLAATNRYQHPTKALSLTNMGNMRLDVSEIGFLSNFRSFNGIHNPSSTPGDALVLSGPHYHFAIPVKMNNTGSCGLSLQAGGLPSRNLMVDCKFDSNGDLTSFRVNSATYYGFDQIHGKSAVEGLTINSPVSVSGVKFNLKAN